MLAAFLLINTEFFMLGAIWGNNAITFLKYKKGY